MSERLRPFKVWNVSRSNKKSITAATLEELIRKGKEKLRYENEEITVVLESDGTEVDDEEYFDFLTEQTTFIFLTKYEEYISACETEEIQCEDVPDTGSSQKSSNEKVEDESRSIHELGEMLRKDFSMIHTLSREEIQKLLNLSAEELGWKLVRSKRDAHHIQLTCQRILDQMRDNDDAIQFVELLKKNRIPPGNPNDAVGDGPIPKRNKLSNS